MLATAATAVRRRCMTVDFMELDEGVLVVSRWVLTLYKGGGGAPLRKTFGLLRATVGGGRYRLAFPAAAAKTFRCQHFRRRCTVTEIVFWLRNGA